MLIDLTAPRERWRRLGHGYRVQPRIVVWESADVLRVPLAALFCEGERWAVFVENGGRAALRQVQLGQQNGIDAQIVSGLAPGERIVLHPNYRIANGSRIIARAAG